MLHYNTIDRCGLVVQEYNENLMLFQDAQKGISFSIIRGAVEKMIRSRFNIQLAVTNSVK